MKNQDTLRHKKKKHFTLWVVVITLFALEACSLSVLVGQMRSFSKQKPTTVISLTEGSDITELEVGTRDEHAAYRLPYSRSVHFAPYRQGLNRMIQLDENSEKVGFWTYDENTIWSTKTDIEIFRLKHDNNNDGVFTVVTSDGDKVFAPGTENDYTFTIKNTNTVSLDYTMEVEAFVRTDVDGVEYWLPIQGRLYNHYTGQYMVGSADEWPDVLELDGAGENGVIAAGNIKDYTLQWRWPFERGEQIQEGLYKGDYTEDFYDTMLGNLAVDHDLELHIMIRTSAWIDENPDEPGGNKPPNTGDANNPTGWIIAAAAAFVGIVILLIMLKRDSKENRHAEG